MIPLKPTPFSENLRKKPQRSETGGFCNRIGPWREGGTQEGGGRLLSLNLATRAKFQKEEAPPPL